MFLLRLFLFLMQFSMLMLNGMENLDNNYFKALIQKDLFKDIRPSIRERLSSECASKILTRVPLQKIAYNMCQTMTKLDLNSDGSCLTVLGASSFIFSISDKQAIDCSELIKKIYPELPGYRNDSICYFSPLDSRAIIILQDNDNSSIICCIDLLLSTNLWKVELDLASLRLLWSPDGKKIMSFSTYNYPTITILDVSDGHTIVQFDARGFKKAFWSRNNTIILSYYDHCKTYDVENKIFTQLFHRDDLKISSLKNCVIEAIDETQTKLQINDFDSFKVYFFNINTHVITRLDLPKLYLDISQCSIISENTYLLVTKHDTMAYIWSPVYGFVCDLNNFIPDGTYYLYKEKQSKIISLAGKHHSQTHVYILDIKELVDNIEYFNNAPLGGEIDEVEVEIKNIPLSICRCLKEYLNFTIPKK